MDLCPFCEIINERADDEEIFRGLFKSSDLESEIVLETEHLAVIVDVGPLVEGHVMIITKKHHLSFADLDEQYWPELLTLKSDLKRALTEIYSPPLFFEHGAGLYGGRGACCVEHAHLQVLPLSINLLPDIIKHFKLHRISGLPDLHSRFSGKAYLYYESAEGYQYAVEVTVCPSQYFRQLIAAKLGQPDCWDWRTFVVRADELGTRDRIRNTYRRIRTYFQAGTLDPH